MKISLERAAELLQSGHVVAVPTETVYGLAASLSHPEAIAAIFALKGRPAKNPLIVHLADAELLSHYAHTFPKELAEAFWPGPMTLVLPVHPEQIPALARANLPTAAFRVPDHPMTRALLQKTGPLVMPSANLSGRPSATTAEHVEADFGRKIFILDGGTTRRGVESTVLREFNGRWEIIRLGAIPPGAFEPVLGYVPAIIGAKEGEAPVCPGQLYRHYAPAARLIPTTQFSQEMQGAVVGFTDRRYPEGCRLFGLGSSICPESVAENLYATLRLLDEEKVPQAFLDMRLPKEGLWMTLAERLEKAAQS